MAPPRCYACALSIYGCVQCPNRILHSCIHSTRRGDGEAAGGGMRGCGHVRGGREPLRRAPRRLGITVDAGEAPARGHHEQRSHRRKHRVGGGVHARGCRVAALAMDPNRRARQDVRHVRDTERHPAVLRGAAMGVRPASRATRVSETRRQSRRNPARPIRRRRLARAVVRAGRPGGSPGAWATHRPDAARGPVAVRARGRIARVGGTRRRRPGNERERHGRVN